MNTYKVTNYDVKKNIRLVFEVKADSCDAAALSVWPEGKHHSRYANTQSDTVSEAARDNCHYQNHSGFRGVWAQNVEGLAEAEAFDKMQQEKVAEFFKNLHA
jgi:hypothetical protein